jgi:phosphate/sulfate permease
LHGDDAINLKKQNVPEWILLIGGVGIAAGLIVLGRKVIKSVGESITKLSPSRGVAIEVGTAFTVLLFSKLGVPVSSTHTLVGSIFAMGLSEDIRKRVLVYWQRKTSGSTTITPPSHSAINIKKIIIIFSSWILTLPIAGALAAAFVAAFRLLI